MLLYTGSVQWLFRSALSVLKFICVDRVIHLTLIQDKMALVIRTSDLFEELLGMPQ